MATERKQVDVKVRNDEVLVNPETVHLKVERDEAVWSCKDGDLDISFSSQKTPFNRSSFQAPKGKDCDSGAPLKGKASGNPYKYTVTVTTITGRYSKDPNVIVEE